MIIDPGLIEELKLDMTTGRRILHSGDGYSAAYLTGVPGAGATAHSHPHAQFVYIISGGGRFILGAEEFEIQPDQAIAIPPNEPHTFLEFFSETAWLEFFTPEREEFKY